MQLYAGTEPGTETCSAHPYSSQGEFSSEQILHDDEDVLLTTSSMKQIYFYPSDEAQYNLCVRLMSRASRGTGCVILIPKDFQTPR